MAKRKRTRAKVNIGLANVEAALDMVVQTLGDIRLAITAMRRQETAGAHLSVPARPGLPCEIKTPAPGQPCKGPGKPCRPVGPGKPCRPVGPGKPCKARP